MSKQKELQMKQYITQLVDDIDYFMSESYTNSRSYHSPDSILRMVSESIDIIMRDDYNTHTDKQKRSMILDIFSTFSPINTSIIQILGHQHPIHTQVSELSYITLGSKCLDDKFDWDKFIFPVSLGNLNNQDWNDSFKELYRQTGSMFGLFLKRFMTTFNNDYRTLLSEYGRLHNLTGRLVGVVDITAADVYDDMHSFDSITKAIKINIIRQFLENVDANVIDTVIECITEHIDTTYCLLLSGKSVVDREKLFTFVEIFIYGLIKEYDVIYTVVYNLVDRNHDTNDAVAEINKLIAEYGKFEELCTTDFKKVIGADAVIDHVFDYLMNSDVENLLDLKAKIDIFNESMRCIMSIKYFLDSEIRCGSVSLPDSNEKEFKTEIEYKKVNEKDSFPF